MGISSVSAMATWGTAGKHVDWNGRDALDLFFFCFLFFFLPHDMYCVALRCIAFGLGLGLGFWHGTAGQGIARAACGGECGNTFLRDGHSGACC